MKAITRARKLVSPQVRLGSGEIDADRHAAGLQRLLGLGLHGRHSTGEAFSREPHDCHAA